MSFTSYDLLVVVSYAATVGITYGSQTGVFGATNKEVIIPFRSIMFSMSVYSCMSGTSARTEREQK
jgi:hypothetical protein